MLWSHITQETARDNGAFQYSSEQYETLGKRDDTHSEILINNNK